MKSLVRAHKYALALLCFLSFAGTLYAQTFASLKDPECITGGAFYGWTVGGQYLDANNGVVQGGYSNLVRWQGDDMVNNWVSYDMGAFTSFHTTPQRGRQPEDPNGSPGVQLNCYDVGMLVNTWDTPHRPIIGGGYNDIWGYAWPAGTQPHPFVDGSGNPSELVLQANIGVAVFSPTPSDAGVGQTGLFAYIRDTSHPALHPIVILASAYISDWTTGYWNSGRVSADYGDSDTSVVVANNPSWFAPGTSGNGVWFASQAISNMGGGQQYVTTRFTQGSNDGPLLPIYTSNPAFPFWRGHITQTNLAHIVSDINNNLCGPPDCPSTGYSTNPADYVLDFAGVITEVRIKNEIVDHVTPAATPGTTTHFDASPTSWIPNDPSKGQTSMGVHIYGFGVYQYLP